MIKSIVMSSQSPEDSSKYGLTRAARAQMLKQIQGQDSEDEFMSDDDKSKGDKSDDEMHGKGEEVDEVAISTQIIKSNVSVIGKSLNAFWKQNEKNLKSALSGKRRPQGVNLKNFKD